ncbi:hypothetical protein CHLNCDRAFT_18967 [Chlorella variabilis]|uniref:Serine/threonine-protein phosphatase 2A activator n=1 Tax=Chlorella variabilis TaxID=554065 RepID=E1Z570_CHLVA|nr:hypothetical protein CHLNCDRAFT_18967 [Chlorella variabilis]EFN59472.1 hypothetical protein CHLNCDRAFT_18967 [Chlorella variabilis]|eukprot:XP_005851574.1 hypothetical protein CHLNCDRAFT_18967 [Chlorella variabilis]
MAPTAAPWAKPGVAGPGSSAPLPAVSRGELTKAPWAAVSGPALTGRPVEAAVPRAQPRLPSVPSADFSGHAFVPAAKRILSTDHLKQFLRSDVACDLVSFILALNKAVKGKQLSDPCEESEAVRKLVGVLDMLWRWVDEIPAAAHTLRYGNPAFRTWSLQMTQQAPQLVASVLPAGLQAAAGELAGYFADSFGNATRIDYGTGHETTFCALLYCLAKLGVVGEGDAQALVTRVFARYLELMRKIQTTYWLEPAGSHGVWGLDDYQFLPFVWGSAQLVDHPFIKPSSIHSREVLEGYACEYLYLGAIKFVKQVKKGPLQETSPMLVDISGIPMWSKVNSGMVKMYQAEVLAKFPIMQHFLFGSLIDFSPAAPAAAVDAPAPQRAPPAAGAAGAPGVQPSPAAATGT